MERRAELAAAHPAAGGSVPARRSSPRRCRCTPGPPPGTARPNPDGRRHRAGAGRRSAGTSSSAGSTDGSDSGAGNHRAATNPRDSQAHGEPPVGRLHQDRDDGQAEPAAVDVLRVRGPPEALGRLPVLASVMPGAGVARPGAPPAVAARPVDRHRRVPAAAELTALSISASSAWSSAVGTARATPGPGGPAAARRTVPRPPAATRSRRRARPPRRRRRSTRSKLPPLGPGEGEQAVEHLAEPLGLLQRQPVPRPACGSVRSAPRSSTRSRSAVSGLRSWWLACETNARCRSSESATVVGHLVERGRPSRRSSGGPSAAGTRAPRSRRRRARGRPRRARRPGAASSRPATRRRRCRQAARRAPPASSTLHAVRTPAACRPVGDTVTTAPRTSPPLPTGTATTSGRSARARSCRRRWPATRRARRAWLTVAAS